MLSPRCLPSRPLALLSLPRPAPRALPLPGPLLSGRTVSNKLLHPQVCPPSPTEGEGRGGGAGRGGGRAPLRAPLGRGRPLGERRRPEPRGGRTAAPRRAGRRAGSSDRPAREGPSHAGGGGRGTRPAGRRGWAGAGPGRSLEPRPPPLHLLPPPPLRKRSRAAGGNPGPRPSCLARLRELRQPGQRADRHPGHERLPDRHEEAQGAAEAAQRRQSPVLSAGGSVPRGRPGLAQVTGVAGAWVREVWEGTPDRPAAFLGLCGPDPRWCLGPDAPG